MQTMSTATLRAPPVTAFPREPSAVWLSGLLSLGLALAAAACSGRSVESGQDAGLEAGVDVLDVRDSQSDVEPPRCGDGIRQGSEVCDGIDLGGSTCADLPGYGGGTLGCMGDCSGFDTTDCEALPPGCGNDALEAGEACDGMDFGGLGCTDYGYVSGDLWCAGDCSAILFAGCAPMMTYTCGDGVLQGEWCDGNQAVDSCQDFGFTGGTMGCTPGCHYDFGGCLGDTCALNGEYGDGDFCDPCPLTGGTEDPDCAQLCGVADGWCASYLHLELGFSTCVAMTGLPDPDCGICGNGIAEDVELCDGTDLAQHTPVQPDCLEFGFAGGALACDANCNYDTSGCFF